MLASLFVVLSLSTPAARAAVPGKPGFLAFTTSRNTELANVPVEDVVIVKLRRGRSAPVPRADLRPGTRTRLTFRPGLDDHPSGARGKVVFVSTQEDPAGDLYIREANGTVRRLLANAGADSEPAFSADGTRVAFVNNQHIWMVNASNGSGLRRLTVDDGAHSSPTWAPDGTRVAYSGTRDHPQGSLYTVSVTNPLEVERLTTPGTGIGDIEPAWGINPDADDVGDDDGTILFTRTQPIGRNRALHMLDPRGGGPTRFNVSLAETEQPAWAPGGRLIAFRGQTLPVNSGDDVERAIWVINRNGGDLTRLTAGENETRADPTWSDDENVVFATDEFSSASDIYAMRTSGADLTGITRTQDPETQPAYSPDGRQIAYRLEVNEAFSSIVVANADGTSPELVTNPKRVGGIFDSDPSWSPDGQRLVFGRAQANDGGGVLRRIFTIKLDGTELTDVSPPDNSVNLGSEDPDWSSTNKIAYLRNDHPFEGPAESHLYVLDLATRAHTQVTGTTEEDRNTEDRDPDWSPDGNTLAFSREINCCQSVIFTLSPVAPNGTLTRRTTAPPGPTPPTPPPSHRDLSPAFSPDGSQIAFSRFEVDVPAETSRQDIWIVTLPSGEKPFTAGVPGNESSPTWQPSTDLGIRKTGPSVAQAGQEFAYLLTVNNSSRTDAPDVEVTDTLPAGLDLVRTEPSQGSCNTARPVVCALGTLRAGATATVRVIVVGTRAAVLPNRAQVDGKLIDTDPSDNSDLTRTSVRGTDLAVTVDTPDPVNVGQPLTYRATVTQRGPDSADQVALTVPLPAGATLVSAVADQPDGTCTPPPQGSADPVRCTWPRLTTPEGGVVTRTVTVVVEPTRAEPAVSELRVSSATGELNPADNTFRVETEVRGSDLTVKTELRPPGAHVGGQVIVHATVNNLGRATAANSRLVVQAPPRIACQKPVNGACPGAPSTVTVQLGNVVPGTPVVSDVVLTAAAAGTGTIRVTVLTDTPDVVPGNNTVNANLEVRQPKVELTPPLGSPGSVALARGTDFPPNTKVTLSWKPGITPTSAQVTVGPDGTFNAQMLVIKRDLKGPRALLVKGSGFTEISTEFLVVSGNVDPSGGFVTRN